MKLIGVHFNNLEGPHLPYLGGLNSAWHTLLNPGPGQVAQIKQRSPGTKVLARPFVPDQSLHARYLQGDPVAAGQWAAQLCLNERGSNPDADAWIVLNEPPVSNIADIQRLAAFDIAFMERLHANGMRAGVGAFSVGTLQLPEIDNGAAVRAYEPALRRANQLGALLVIHQYIPGGPNKARSTDEIYYYFRWQQKILPWCRQNAIPTPGYLISETGCDIGADRRGYMGQYDGWQIDRPDGFGNDATGRADYIRALQMLADEYAKDPYCEGATIYCAGGNGDMRWESFRVDGILPDLVAAAFPAPGQNVLAPAPQLPTPAPRLPTPAPQSPTPAPASRLSVPYVSQRGNGANESANDCGAAAIRGLALINRNSVPSVDLLAREAAGIDGKPYPSYDGLRIAALIELGRRYGAALTRNTPGTWNAALNDVRNRLSARQPIIALLHYDNLPTANRLEKRNGIVRGHYVTLVGVDGTNVTYHDPYQNGTDGSNLKMPLATLQAAWEANPQDGNLKYDMLIMTNPQWAPEFQSPSEWTQSDAAKSVWYLEQMARALRGDTGAKGALLGALQAEPAQAGLHNILVARALPPVVAERDNGAP